MRRTPVQDRDIGLHEIAGRHRITAQQREWKIECTTYNTTLILDTHFLGLTPLNDVEPDVHDYEYVLGPLLE